MNPAPLGGVFVDIGLWVRVVPENFPFVGVKGRRAANGEVHGLGPNRGKGLFNTGAVVATQELAVFWGVVK